jgi:hypothetical protein
MGCAASRSASPQHDDVAESVEAGLVLPILAAVVLRVDRPHPIPSLSSSQELKCHGLGICADDGLVQLPQHFLDGLQIYAWREFGKLITQLRPIRHGRVSFPIDPAICHAHADGSRIAFGKRLTPSARNEKTPSTTSDRPASWQVQDVGRKSPDSMGPDSTSLLPPLGAVSA